MDKISFNSGDMRKIKILLSAFLLLLLFGVFPLSVQAFSFQDITDSIKGLFGSKDTPQTNKTLTIDSSIAIVEKGDINKNGKIDSGDSIKFSYTITNLTEDTFHFATLKTNVNTQEINSVRNLQGVLNLGEKDNAIIISNLTIKPNQVRLISFETQINFNKDVDQLITTEPELMDDKNSSVFKAQKKEVTAKKMELEQFNKFVHITK